MNETVIIYIMELIGTIAFAISGALIAVRRSLDLFGVVLVGSITAVGGGIMRDLFLGKFPPNIFSNVIVLIVAAITAIVVFVISYFNANKFESFEKRIESINNFFDAVGLATFSAIGTEMACELGFYDMAIFSISMGMLTGIGGGIIRDILVDSTPYVLKKHIYALASIIGSTIYYLIRINGNKIVALIVSIPIIVVIRLLAAKYHWKLPKINLKN
ncbi:MAG: trimeric intracellular cation channel family protein [Clostridia bacterium]|nr:trimeric intracellular cation channel family protein [Clostridia bacterium]